MFMYLILNWSIENNNREGILPDIDGIQSIECLTEGTIQDVQNGVAKYVIQMRITYLVENKIEEISL